MRAHFYHQINKNIFCFQLESIEFTLKKFVISHRKRHVHWASWLTRLLSLISDKWNKVAAVKICISFLLYNEMSIAHLPFLNLTITLYKLHIFLRLWEVLNVLRMKIFLHGVFRLCSKRWSWFSRQKRISVTWNITQH